MNKLSTFFLLLLAVCLAWPDTASAQYGVYLDLHRRDVFPPPHIDNALVDGVMIGFPWAELEAQQGRYLFDRVESNIKPWAKAGKKVIINIAPSAQGEINFTPAWVFARVPKITFRRAGTDYDAVVPKYWDTNYLAAISPIVREMGARYDSDPRIEAVMISVGHLGYITAAPSDEGGAAFLKAGWTPQRWTQHCNKMITLYREAFPTKRLIIRGSSLLIGVINPSKVGFPGNKPYFTDVRDTILTTAANKRITVGSNGLDADPNEQIRTGLQALFTKLGPNAARNRYQLELSDDWPIWVDAARRLESPADKGKDNAYFARALDNALGVGPGLTRLNVSWIKLFESDLDCTNRSNIDYQAECEAKLTWFKTQLLKPR